MANETIQKIKIFHIDSKGELAEQIGYGIEEEGLPYELIADATPDKTALEETIKVGLGVSVGVSSEKVSIFCRQFKKSEAFMIYDSNSNETLRTIGKNSARIIKHKPFIL